MCGIAGVVDGGGALGPDVVERLNGCQQHRGPDDQVVTEVGSFVLGNTRLAVQDPTPAGNQPFRHPDGSIVVVFNGEIYNFRSLAREAGLELRSGCDGEVIPLLWARYGPECLTRFRGMFAMAVVDRRADRMFLARDPFGIKPLHWRRLEAGVVFASEPGPLARLADPPLLDPAAVAGFLRFGSVPLGRTPWLDVQSIAPGGCVSFDRDGRVRDELSVPAIAASADPAERTADETRRAVLSAVGACLHADVPTALLLSAGVDSSIIAASARRLGVTLRCLTVSSAHPEIPDESDLARETARHYQHDHETVNATIDEQVVDEFLAAMQQPSIDGLNTFLVCRAVAKAGFKVALSGLGADEALGGYRAARLLPALRMLRGFDRLPTSLGSGVARLIESRVGDPAKSRRLLARTGPRDAAGLVRLSRELFAPDVVAALIGRDAAATEPSVGVLGAAARSPVDYRAMAAAELALYLQPMLLPDADGFSMASSIELRVPFVDREFFGAMLSGDRPIGKRGLVSALDDPHLTNLARRAKTGFALPMRRWMQSGPLREVVANARRPDAPLWEVVDRTAGLPLLDGTAERWSEPWALAVLDAWLRRR